MKKINTTTHQILSENLPDSKLNLPNINKDSVFFNYNNVMTEYEFDCNSYDLESLFTDVNIGDSIKLYLKRKDTIANLITGTKGINAFKGMGYSYFQRGYFLPGNKFFVANISAANFEGQIVINTKDYTLMKLKHNTQFYFNINSTDCPDFVFRYKVGPNFKYSTSASAEIKGMKTD